MEELKRNASMAKVFGLPVDVVGPGEIRALYPLANLDDVIGGIHIPSDGYANAVDITQALAKGARSARRADFSGVKVTAIHHDGTARARRGNATAGASTPTTSCCAAACGPAILRPASASPSPCTPASITTCCSRTCPGSTPSLPVLRDYDHCSYFKYDAGKFLVGAFEPHARPWGAEASPRIFPSARSRATSAISSPCSLDAMRRIPALERPAFRNSSAARRASRRTCAITSAKSAELEHASSRPA